MSYIWNGKGQRMTNTGTSRSGYAIRVADATTTSGMQKQSFKTQNIKEVIFNKTANNEKLKHVNDGGELRKKKSTLFDELTQSQIEELKRLYARDFLLFGYDSENF